MTSRTFLKSILGLFCAPAGVRAKRRPMPVSGWPTDGSWYRKQVQVELPVPLEPPFRVHTSFGSHKWEPILKGLNDIKE